MFTLLAMYQVSRLTGEDHYAKAADAYLEFFLRRAASVGNGLFPCGEHAYWDFLKETCTYPTHEDLAFVPHQFLDELWRIDPKATEKHIRQLAMHFLEGDRWVWNRHASILSGKLAMMCLCAHRLTGSREHLEYAKDVWDTYQTLPRPQDEPITPGKFGGLTRPQDVVPLPNSSRRFRCGTGGTVEAG